MKKRPLSGKALDGLWLRIGRDDKALGAGPPRRTTYWPAFNCEYTIVTNRSALVPAAPAGSSPPGTFAS